MSNGERGRKVWLSQSGGHTVCDTFQTRWLVALCCIVTGCFFPDAYRKGHTRLCFSTRCLIRAKFISLKATSLHVLRTVWYTYLRPLVARKPVGLARSGEARFRHWRLWTPPTKAFINGTIVDVHASHDSLFDPFFTSHRTLQKRWTTHLTFYLRPQKSLDWCRKGFHSGRRQKAERGNAFGNPCGTPI